MRNRGVISVDIEENSQTAFIADFARAWIPHASDRQEFLEKENRILMGFW